MGVVLPRRPRYLADIDIAVAVDVEPVRRAELASRQPRFLIDPGDQLAVARHDAEARPEIGKLGVDRLVRPQLADIAAAMRAAFHVEAAWPMQIVPLRLEPAV